MPTDVGISPILAVRRLIRIDARCVQSGVNNPGCIRAGADVGRSNSVPDIVQQITCTQIWGIGDNGYNAFSTDKETGTENVLVPYKRWARSLNGAMLQLLRFAAMTQRPACEA